MLFNAALGNYANCKKIYLKYSCSVKKAGFVLCKNSFVIIYLIRM